MCVCLDHMHTFERKWNFPGVVGGSDLAKAKEQLGEDYLELVDWGFPENGLNAFKDGKSIAVQSLKKHLGDENINRFINYVLRYLPEGLADRHLFQPSAVMLTGRMVTAQ